jgi:hypothetical protein
MCAAIQRKKSHCCEVTEIVENVKFCQKLGKSASKMFQMIKQAYGEEALDHIAVFKWHKCFAQGRDSLKDDEHTIWPRKVRTELNIQEVGMLVDVNHSKVVDEVTAAAEISHGTCHKSLTDDLTLPSAVFHIT